MATYKLIQDIEAEDHILGPLTLRQFIFALISVFFFYISFILLTKGVAFLLVLFLPPALFFGFFAVPFGRDQPTEIWALAKIRFYIKPRKRLWDQSGIKQLVTITAPKKIEKVYTDGLKPYEVKSRLKVLAETLDSRGWAVKNANMVTANAFVSANAGVMGGSDRLIDVNTFAASVPDDSSADETDILDEDYSPIAQHFNQMIDETSAQHRQDLIDKMNSAAPIPPPSSSGSNGQWFMPQAPEPEDNKSVYAADVAAQSETAEEAELVSRIKSDQQRQNVFSNNLRTLQPMSNQTQPAAPVDNSVQAPQDTTLSPLTDQTDPAILSLANNNDFSVDTLAREAKRAKGEEPGQDEVVISLH